ncbi:MAG: aminotransferase class V-fold PLP-dependent enzyme [Candidatus Eremiobacteraeota bacterium]|nr:aminotransferase class V-fold PLP-dependent enzyme [Candidatus Eremiobacteraeota bacterium]
MNELDRWRADTPGCARVAHFNNAGAALMPTPVLEAVNAHLQLEAERGGYEAARLAQDRLEAVYDSVARLLGSQGHQIALLENATRAWDMVFYSLPLKPGDRILTSVSEYASNYIAFLQRARQTGAVVEVVPNDAQGQLDLAALEEMLDERVVLVAINHVPTNSGLVQPASAVGALLANHPALYLLDACQSAGQMPTRVDELGCDFLSATSRKYLRGPRGVGFLYVRKPTELEPAVLDLHAAQWTSTQGYTIRSDARRFETWEGFVAGRLGLGAAIDYALEVGLASAWDRISRLAAGLRHELAEIEGLELRDQGKVLGGIVTFTAGLPPDEIRARLEAQNINVSTCSRLAARLDMEDKGLDQVVRASVHYYNTEEEIRRLAQVLSLLRA